MRHVLIALFICMGSILSAAPQDYTLDPESSTVAFLWRFGGDQFEGTMDVVQADLSLDFDNVSNSTLTVAVDASKAEAGFPFATQAMRGPRVLDTANHPLITFRSTTVTQTGPGEARIEGFVTARGVTQPTTLTAQIYRAAGTDPNDLSRLTLLVKGALKRSEFGADGWSDLVRDRIRLEITAQIEAR